MKNKQERINKLFYEEHLKIKDISKKMKTSSAQITNIIKKDERYIQEKNYRKEISKEKRKLDQKTYIKNKRDNKRIVDNFSEVEVKHIQASIELSKSKHLSNENYRKWNKSAYKYNPLKRQYEFDEELGRSYDVPKYIKER